MFIKAQVAAECKQTLRARCMEVHASSLTQMHRSYANIKEQAHRVIANPKAQVVAQDYILGGSNQYQFFQQTVLFRRIKSSQLHKKMVVLWYHIKKPILIIA